MLLHAVGAAKCIRSMRRWAYQTFRREGVLHFVAMATPDDVAANAECARPHALGRVALGRTNARHDDARARAQAECAHARALARFGRRGVELGLAP